MREVAEQGLWRQAAWVLIAALLLAGFVTLGNKVTVFYPLFSIYEMDVIVVLHSKDYEE